MPFFLLLLVGLVGCGGVSPTARAATLTGTLSSLSSGCAGGIRTVQTTDEAGGKRVSTLDSDCSFSAQVTPQSFSYLRFLDSGGSTVALLAWEDPTQLNDGSSLALTSFLKMPSGGTHDLGAVTLVEAGSLSQSLRIMKGVSAGRPSAIPETAPIGFDLDGDGVPDDNEAGFRHGGDGDGDGIPEISTTADDCLSPGTGPLYGRLLLRPIRNDATTDEIEALAAATGLPSNLHLTSTGFELDPIPAQGDWVVFGEKTDTSKMAMVNAHGDFTLSSIPEGVAVAKVFKDLEHDEPMMHLPLCLLKSDPAEVSDATAIIQKVPFPDPCFMDSTTTVCTDPAAALENSLMLSTAKPLATHVTCGADNAAGCCLDYDGPLGTSGRPHNSYEHMIAYLGSTCAAYVNANCCVNERGTAKNLVLSGLGLKQLTPCFFNHVNRNCQNIDLGVNCLVLSSSQTLRGTPDSSSNPESITVACNSQTTLYHHNNCCVNEDVIALSGCGSLDKSGVLQHGLGFSGGVYGHLTDLDLVYTAPSSACTAAVTSQAWGYTRTVNITVSCKEETSTEEASVSFTTNPTSASFTHQVGSSSCPQAVTTVTLTNGSSQTLTFEMTASTSQLSISPSSASAAPGGSATFSVSFTCAEAASFTGTVAIRATGSSDGKTSSGSVTVTGTVQ